MAAQDASCSAMAIGSGASAATGLSWWRTIQVDAQTREIVGVMPRGFRLIDHDFDYSGSAGLRSRQSKTGRLSAITESRGSSQTSASRRPTPTSRACFPVWMDSWSNGPGTQSALLREWRITPGFRSLKQQVIGGIGGVLWVVMAHCRTGHADRLHQRRQSAAGARRVRASRSSPFAPRSAPAACASRANC